MHNYDELIGGHIMDYAKVIERFTIGNAIYHSGIKKRRLISLVLALLCVLGLVGCSQKEPFVVNTYYTVSDTEVAHENDDFIILVKHYEMSDGTWKTDNCTYKYRLEITGRMPNAVKDSTFVFLSNIEDISFQKAMMASGLSSNMEDYFDEETAKFVGMK